MLTSVGPGREEESHNLRIQDSLHKNEGLATFTPRCHKGLQKQPVPATCQTTSHLNTFATVILLTGKLFPGMNLTTRDKASLTTLFKAPLSRPRVNKSCPSSLPFPSILIPLHFLTLLYFSSSACYYLARYYSFAYYLSPPFEYKVHEVISLSLLSKTLPGIGEVLNTYLFHLHMCIIS